MSHLFEFSTTVAKCQCDFKPGAINLLAPTSDLFDTTAKELAKELANPEIAKLEGRFNNQRCNVKRTNKSNKPTQIRKFFDEIKMWQSKTTDTESLERNLAFIKMLNAKAAYARGRELVDDKFVVWLSHCLGQIQKPDEQGLATFNHFCLLFEAVLGFYKQERPKD